MAVVDEFVDLYWNKFKPWTQTYWRGHHISKAPTDAWTYQEIIHETQPELIIETGTSAGGSALFFADIMEHTLAASIEVITIDPWFFAGRPKHSVIEYVDGDSLHEQIIGHVKAKARGKRVMVALDSLHTYEHVLAELEAYAPLVSPGCYLVVEDTAVDEAWKKPAARAAVVEYLRERPWFEVDESREKQLLTLNPGGWIRRIV